MSTAQQITATTEAQNKPSLAPTLEWLQMSKKERAAWLRENGKGYLSKEEREERLRLHHGDVEMVYSAEGDKANKANKANKADDDETFWQWYSLVILPAYSLKSLKRRRGADFIRDLGFDTSEADEAYGRGWLEE